MEHKEHVQGQDECTEWTVVLIDEMKVCRSWNSFPAVIP